MEKSLGQLAYEEWLTFVPPRKPWFPWSSLPKPAKEAWEKVAKNIVRYALTRTNGTSVD